MNSSELRSKSAWDIFLGATHEDDDDKDVPTIKLPAPPIFLCQALQQRPTQSSPAGSHFNYVVTAESHTKIFKESRISLAEKQFRQRRLSTSTSNSNSQFRNSSPDTSLEDFDLADLESSSVQAETQRKPLLFNHGSLLLHQNGPPATIAGWGGITDGEDRNILTDTVKRSNQFIREALRKVEDSVPSEAAVNTFDGQSSRSSANQSFTSTHSNLPIQGSEKSNSMENVLASISSTVVGSGKNFIQLGDGVKLSRNERDDLEAFLNMDDLGPSVVKAPVEAVPAKASSFGSSLHSGSNVYHRTMPTTAVTAKVLAERKNLSISKSSSLPSKLLLNASEIDCSFGMGVPVQSWSDQIMANYTTLTSLILPGNQLTSMPSEIVSASRLTLLDASYNSLTTIPEWIGQLLELKTLHLHHNSIATIPESLSKCTQLETLRLFKNQLNGPNVIRCLRRLTKLNYVDLSANRLGSIPDELLCLPKLEYLDLSSNQLVVRSDSSNYEAVSLKVLLLRNNKLTTVPQSFGTLVALEVLNLSWNKLPSIDPTVMNRLSNLRELYLAYNLLGSFELEKNPRRQLEIIDVRRNPALSLQLTVLAQIESLDTVLMDASALPSTIPAHIYQKGWLSIRTYLLQKETGSVDAKKTFAYGTGLAAYCLADQQESFRIRAVSQDGNHKMQGGDKFTVLITHINLVGIRKEIKAAVIDLKDGTYLVEYICPTCGSLEIHVTFMNQPIRDSPFRVALETSNAFDEDFAAE